MKTRRVLIEKEGTMIPVGKLSENQPGKAVFSYDESYLRMEEARAVSVSLPLQKEAFSAEITKSFFDGLLPEGFTRRTVAQMMHKDENDYLALLTELGQECIGAIQILGDGQETIRSDYEQLEPEQIKKLAEEGTKRSAEVVAKTHLSLTGASGKAGLYCDDRKQWYLPIGDAPSTHIVKQSHIRLESIVANEQLSLLTAKALGLDVPESFIINTGRNRDEDILFATKRFDRSINSSKRTINGLPAPARLHQEDFAQALGIGAAEKYETERKGYLRSMFRLLRVCSADPVRDQMKLWDLIIFDFLIGNTDNHIKNVSLLYSPDLSSVRLAPAYDILSTAAYERSIRDMAFFIGSENRLDHIDRTSFEEAAQEAGLGGRMAMKRFERLKDGFENALRDSAELLKAQGFERIGAIREKIMELGGIARFMRS